MASEQQMVGSYIRNYREGKGIPLKVKIVSLALLWMAIVYSTVFVASGFLVRFILVLIAICVTIHILSFKALRVRKGLEDNRRE